MTAVRSISTQSRTCGLILISFSLQLTVGNYIGDIKIYLTVILRTYYHTLIDKTASVPDIKLVMHHVVLKRDRLQLTTSPDDQLISRQYRLYVLTHTAVELLSFAASKYCVT